MAAVVLRCQGPDCGREFVAKRRHARWCSDRCRMAFARQQAPDLVEAEIDDAIMSTAYPEHALIAVLIRLEAAA